MMGGAEIEDARTAIARDTQFELYVAAVLTLGGLDVRAGEPDLRLLYGYETVGIAAKRIRSTAEKQVRRHVGKAVKQIETSGFRGWIAVNLDTRFMTIRLGQQKSALLTAFEEAFDFLNQALAKYAHNPAVLGVLVYGYVTEWSGIDDRTGKPKLDTAAPFRWFGWGSDPGELLLYRDVVTGWNERLQNRLDAFAAGKLDCGS